MSDQSIHKFSDFLSIALAITLLRIVYLFFNHRNLDVEEAQYWTWSQHLALGYHSKPPMVSWVIYFSTGLFGHSEWAIRLFSPLTYLLTSAFLYQCGKNLYHPAVGFWAGLTVLLLPGVTYSATIISTDPLLILFWSAALCAFIKGCQTGKIRWWIGCGFAIGLGLLSKYTMILFFLSAGLYFICSIKRPSALKRLGPYIAVVIAVSLFLPNVVWNTQHHNAAIHHVIEHNIDIEGVHFHLKNLGVFLLTQVGILGPVLAIFLVVALFRSSRMAETDASRLLICFTVPMLIMISGEALLSRAYANWAVIAYPSGAVLAVAYMWEKNYRRWLWFNLILHIIIAVLLCGWELAIAYGYCNWPKPARPDWQDFGAAVLRQHTVYPNAVYLVDNRELWSKTLYYGKVSRDQLFVWDPHKTVDWVDNPDNLSLPSGKNFIFITHNSTVPADIMHSVKQYTKLDDLLVSQRLLGRQTHIYIYWLRGVKF